MTSSTIKRKKFPYIKWLLIAIVLIALAGLAYYFLKPKEKAPEYLTATVTTGDIEDSVMATGKIEAISSVDVGSEASGKVERLLVDVGSEVKQGDIIAQIEQINQKDAVSSAEASLVQSQSALQSAHGELASREAELDSAKATLATRRAELAKAERNFARLDELIKINAISRQEYDDARAGVEVARAAVVAAQASIRTAQAGIHNAKASIQSQNASVQKSQTDVNTAKTTLSRTVITAPMNGTVVSITTKQGQTVNAMQTAPTIVTLADLSRVRIKAQISEADVINIKAGLPAKFNIIGAPDQKFDAVLDGIEPASEKSSSGSSSTSAVYYIGYLDVDNNEGRFRLDMTTQVNIIIAQAKNVLTVPSASINEKNGKHYIRVVDADGKANEVEVVVGINNRATAEIKSGLKQGDTIVVSEGAADNKPRHIRM